MSARAPLHDLAADDLLAGLPVLEVSSGVAAAYAGKVLAQLGACVARLDRPTDAIASPAVAPHLQQHLHGAKRAVSEGELSEAILAAEILIVEQRSPDPQVRRVAEAIAAGEYVTRPGVRVLTISHAADAAGPRPGCGLTSAAAAGMSWAIGAPGRPPLTLPYDIADYELGVAAAAAVLADLLAGAARRPRAVDVAGRDVLGYFVGQLVPNYLPYGRPWRREGRRPSMSGGVYPCGLFPCRDGLVAIYCRSDREWHGVLAAMGDPAWSREPRFRDPKRIARDHADEADAHLLPWLAGFTRAAVAELATAFDFPAAPVRAIGEVIADPQFAHRRSLERLGETGLVVPAAPWRLFGTSRPPAAPVARPTAPDDPSRLLAGLRVLDFSWVWSGPMVSSILADLGAEVIKVEHPTRLDSLRLRGRPGAIALADPAAPDHEVNPWFNQLNHGKKSVLLDIKQEADQRRALALAQTCDVVIENMRPGALDRMGLGYRDLAAINPSLVMLSMSMAGQTGPASQSKGYAGIMSALAGLEGLVGYDPTTGTPETTGMTMTALGDPNAAMHALAVLFAALHARRQTGRGAWIDLAQTDAVLAIMGGPVLESQLAGTVPIWGNSHPRHVPHAHFRCAGTDAWIALAVRSDGEWARLVDLSDGALAQYAGLDAPGRRALRRELQRAVAAWTATRDKAALARTLTAAGIAASPVADYAEMSRAAWQRERGLTCAITHPFLGEQAVFVPPWHFDGAVGVARAPAPLLGADTAAVLDTLQGEAHGLPAH